MQILGTENNRLCTCAGDIKPTVRSWVLVKVPQKFAKAMCSLRHIEENVEWILKFAGVAFDIPGSCDSKKHESSGSKNVHLAAPTSCDSLPRTRRCSFGCKSLAPIRTRRTWRNSMKPWAPRFPRSPQPQQHQQPGHQQRPHRRAPLRLAQRQHRILIRHCGRSWRSDLDDGKRWEVNVLSVV